MRGGRPAAFEPRYVLLPSVLMISIAAVSLVTLGRAGDRTLRAFIILLSLATVVVNLGLCHDSIELAKHLDHYSYTTEARNIARRMRNLRSKRAPPMVLE